MKNILLFSLLALLFSCDEDSNDKVAVEISIEDLHTDILPIYDANINVWADRCGLPLACDDIVQIDCGSETDGPRNYFNNSTGEVVMYCGGSCLIPGTQPLDCEACPPPEWLCVNVF